MLATNTDITKKRITLDKQSVQINQDVLRAVKAGADKPGIFGRVGRCTATGYCYNTSIAG